MSSIKVAIRCRPLFGQERPASGLDIQNKRILLDSKTYDPDFTFPPSATQDDVFQACKPILQAVKEGMNGTMMVYGQTGTGKTFTMLGTEGKENGLVHKVVADMLEYVQQKTKDGAQCALTLSMIEIYNEKLTDMLSDGGEEEVTLMGGFPRFTKKSTLCRVSDAHQVIQQGLGHRHTAATMMNERSSRSHVVIILDYEEYNSFTNQFDVAHLFLVDLAGSESLKKSQASGVAAGEAGKINKSLLALKTVLLALSNTNEATRPSHVPYRDSKLTELLQDSIGGGARTLMIACISSVGRDIEETKSTLMYAVKARSIRNAANTEKEKLLVRLRSMEVENQKLRNRLQERVSERGGYYVTKEEHEQAQAADEELSTVKKTVEELLKDRQNSDARGHISESQSKVLQALLEDKDGELQAFKQVYHTALQRFERQGTVLQNLVRDGVHEAKEAVQSAFAGNFQKLSEWRLHMMELLEVPPMVEEDEEAVSCTAAAPPQGGPAGEEEERGGGGCAPPLESPAISPTRGVQGRVGAARVSLPPSASVSPSRRGRQGEKHHAHRPGRRGGARPPSPLPPPVPAPVEVDEEDAVVLPAAASPTSTSYLAAYDKECQRVVRRANTAVRQLLDQLLASYMQHAEEASAIEARRQDRVHAVCADVKSYVSEQLERLLKAEATAHHDATEVRDAFTRSLQLQASLPPRADAAVLHDTLRNMGSETVSYAATVFPPPCAPADTTASLDRLLLALQRQMGSFSVQSLDPLRSNALCGGESAEASAVASPVQRPSMAAALMASKAAAPEEEDSDVFSSSQLSEGSAGSAPLRTSTTALSQRPPNRGEQGGQKSGRVSPLPPSRRPPRQGEGERLKRMRSTTSLPDGAHRPSSFHRSGN